MKRTMILTVWMIWMAGGGDLAAQTLSEPAAPAPGRDQQALQELRDLGVSPQEALELVREGLMGQAAALQEPAPGQSEADPATYGDEPVSGTATPQGPAPAVTGPGTPPTDGETSAPAVVVTPPEVRDASDFHDALSPYGSWIDDPAYGVIWQPYATVTDVEWRPYCQDGRWIWTDHGWYWNSIYTWGWAPFHYGRWCFLPRHRWCWAPDTVWAPAWVCWRSASDYVGWAPLPFGTWRRRDATFQAGPDDARWLAGYGLDAHCFTFVRTVYFRALDLARLRLKAAIAVEVFRDSAIIGHSIAIGGNRIANMGIPKSKVERILETGIPTSTIEKKTVLPAKPVMRTDLATRIAAKAQMKAAIMREAGHTEKAAVRALSPTPAKRPSKADMALWPPTKALPVRGPSLPETGEPAVRGKRSAPAPADPAGRAARGRGWQMK